MPEDFSSIVMPVWGFRATTLPGRRLALAIRFARDRRDAASGRQMEASFGLTSDQARELARHLLASADEAEREKDGPQSPH